MKKICILPAFLLAVNILNAQTETDIARFSRITNYGTARSAAMGGAFTALGGDISTLSSNPAGIGVFRKSEVSFTPSLNFSNTKSGKYSAEDASFQAGTLGAVFSFHSSAFDWKGVNFGFNYTNMNNFNRKTNQYVFNSPTSLLQVFADQAYGISGGDLEDLYTSAGNSPAGLAYQTYIIDRSGLPDDVYYPLYGNDPIYDVRINTNQHKTIDESGYQGEYAFSIGTNYKDKLYLGMTIGMQNIHYKISSVYSENAANASESELAYYNYNEFLETHGTGVNFKAGIIFRPIPQLRLGAAIHTPTYYNMTDSYNYSIYSKFTTVKNDRSDYTAGVPLWDYEYDMKTPWRAMFGAALVIGKSLILSADYEYVDYTTAKFSNGDNGEDFYGPDGTGTNDYIKAYLRTANNYRAGAELRLNNAFSLRAGYALSESPYRYDTKNNKLETLSGGFGLNFGMFYLDAAYLQKTSKDQTVFYDYEIPENPPVPVKSEVVENTYKNGEVRVTLGLRF